MSSCQLLRGKEGDGCRCTQACKKSLRCQPAFATSACTAIPNSTLHIHTCPDSSASSLPAAAAPDLRVSCSLVPDPPSSFASQALSALLPPHVLLIPSSHCLHRPLPSSTQKAEHCHPSTYFSRFKSSASSPRKDLRMHMTICPLLCGPVVL